MSIQPGDLVQLVWGCCASARRHMGWTGTVEFIEDVGEGSDCEACDVVTHGRHAAVVVDGVDSWVPLSWLKKIEPDSTPEHVEHREELTAC